MHSGGLGWYVRLTCQLPRMINDQELHTFTLWRTSMPQTAYTMWISCDGILMKITAFLSSHQIHIIVKCSWCHNVIIFTISTFEITLMLHPAIRNPSLTLDINFHLQVFLHTWAHQRWIMHFLWTRVAWYSAVFCFKICFYVRLLTSFIIYLDKVMHPEIVQRGGNKII